MITLILTVIGDDRPGLVQTLSDVVVRGGGTWNQSSMSRLGSKFAGIVEVGVADDLAETLTADLRAIGDDVLEVGVAVTAAASSSTATTRTVTLELVGQDRPGIVHDISVVLAALDVGIEELETLTSSAPMSAEQLFEARAVLAVPEAVGQAELADALERIAQELMVDLELVEL